MILRKYKGLNARQLKKEFRKKNLIYAFNIKKIKINPIRGNGSIENPYIIKNMDLRGSLEKPKIINEKGYIKPLKNCNLKYSIFQCNLIIENITVKSKKCYFKEINFND